MKGPLAPLVLCVIGLILAIVLFAMVSLLSYK